MLHTAYIFLSTVVSWTIGLIFIRMKRIEVLYNSAIAGAVCGITEYLLYRAGIGYLLPPAMLLLFILMMLAVQLQNQGKYGMSLMAFMMSLSAETVFSFSENQLSSIIGTSYKMLFSLCIIILYVLATVILRKNFPENDWQDYFMDSPGDNHRLEIQKYHIYLAMAAQCIASVCCLTLINTNSLGTVIAVVIGFAILYWSIVICVILMIDYKKETLTIIMEQQYRDEMQSFMNVIRSQRHDYNFHVQTLAGMINNGNLESCRKYVNELVKDSIAMNTMLPIKDPAISAMINNFRILAAREGIELHIDIQNDLSSIVTNVYETNKIISNLLQNAIDEVKTHKDKSYGIWLYIFKRGEFCNIHVANELGEDMPQEDYVMNIYKQGYTTKLGHDGIGLSSIQTLAKRYKGLIYTYLEGNIIHFIAEIPISI